MTSKTYNRVQCDPTCNRGYLKANLRVNGKRFLFTTGCKISNPQDGKTGKQLYRYLQPHEIEVYEKLRQDLVAKTYRILHEGGNITRENLLDTINRSSSQLLVDLKRFVEYKEKLVSYQTYRSSYRPLMDYMI